LAAGQSIELDILGGGQLKVKIQQGAMQALVSNSGTINSDAGQISLTAKGVGQLLSSVVNNSGILQAKGIRERRGRIFLDSGDDGRTELAGLMDARNDAGIGGSIHATGYSVRLASSSRLDASGQLGGGDILMGGGWQGQTTLRHAKQVSVQAGAQLKANALSRGDGGTIVAWSDLHGKTGVTRIEGAQFEAKGGLLQGDGGRIETSGHQVKIADGAKFNTLATQGRVGQWLIDPVDYTVATSGGDISGTTLSSNLASNHVAILSANGTAGVNGDIHINDEVSWNANTTLTLSAFRNINFNANVSASANSAGVVLTTNTGGGGGTHQFAPNKALSLTGSSPSLTINGQSYVVINSLGAPDSSTGTDLQGMQGNLSANYALGSSIDASATSGWNIGEGFAPIGTFTGNFDGLGHKINNLYINRPNSSQIGLFSWITGPSFIRNIGLTNVQISGSSNTGALVGESDSGSKIISSYSTGTINSIHHRLGGLIGYCNTCEVEKSYSTVNVTTLGSGAGGLIGLANSSAISNSYAAGNVLVQSFADHTGGLIGIIENTTVHNSYASGQVTSFSNTGGLIGSVRNSALNEVYATGAVNSSGGNSGGLLGSASNTNISNSYSSGQVNGQSRVGGIIGDATGSWGSTTYYITNSWALGNVTGAGPYIGGLIGSAAGGINIDNVYATGNVININPANYGGACCGGWATGGLIGVASSVNISRAFTTGNVLAELDRTGGLIGHLEQSQLSTSYATGTVSGEHRVGGLVGSTDHSSTSISNSYASGNVTAQYNVGGLVGEAYQIGLITNSYASGNVTAINDTSGGLIGSLSVPPGAVVSYTYSTGIVTNSNWNTGGLIGSNNSNTTIINSYWSITGSGQSLGVGGGSSTGVEGKTINELLQASNFTGWDISGTGASNTVWRIYEGYTAPLLRSWLIPLTITSDAISQTYSASSTSPGLLNPTYSTTPNLTKIFKSINNSYNNGNTKMTVGNYTPTVYSVQQNGYDISNVGGVLTIIPKSVSITGATASNKVYDSTLTASIVNSGSLNGAIGGDTVTFSAGTANFDNKNVGTGKTVTFSGFSLSGSDAGNYTLSQPSNTTANITTAVLSIGGVMAANKVYNATTVATISNSGALSGVLGSDSVTLNAGSGIFADKNAGIGKTVTFSGFSLSGTDASNYTLASQPANGTADITPASVFTIGFTPANKVYDSTTAATLSSGALSAVLGSDSVTLTAGTGSFADKNVGNSKSILLSGFSISGTDASNYTLILPTLTATIARANVGITGMTAASKVYDTTTAATLNGSGMLSGVLGSDMLTLNAGTGSFSDKNAGTVKTILFNGFSISGTDASNYTLVLPTLNANIAPASLSITGVTAADKIYDATTAATLNNSGLLSGLLGSDSVTLNTGFGSFANKNAGAGKTVAFSGFSLSGSDAANYTLSQPAGSTANITAASLSISGVAAANKVYDATTVATFTGSGALSGVLGSDSVMLNAGTGSFIDKNVGAGKTVAFNGFTLGGSDAGNYTLVGQPVNSIANITTATLFINGAAAANKVYDATTAATLNANGLLSGVLSSDSVTLNAGSASFANKNAGTGKTILFNGFSISGTDASNYTLVLPTLNANIAPASLSITGVAAGNKVYDATATASLSNSGLLSGVLGSDIVTLNAGTSLFADKNAGVGKTVTFSGFSLIGNDAANYTLSQPSSATANITAASLSISGVAAGNKVYDATTAATLSNTGTLSGVLASDSVALNAGIGSFVDKNVGVGKWVAFSGFSLRGSDASNYTLLNQPVNSTANITTATLSISGVAAANKVYDATTAATLSSSGALSGVLGSDSVTWNTGFTSFSDKNVGAGKTVFFNGFSISGADASNYTLILPMLTANIAPASLTVTGVAAANKIYNATLTASLINSGLLSGVLGSDSVTLNAGMGFGRFADKNTGVDKEVTFTGFSLEDSDAANYTLGTVTTTASISPRLLNLSVIGNTKTYDATLVATVSVTDDRLSADSLSLQYQPRFVDKNVGVGKTIGLQSLVLGGADANNYQIVGTPTTTADIRPAPLALSGITVSNKAFDSSTTASWMGTPQINPFAEDDVKVTGTAIAAFANAAVGRTKPVALSGFELSGVDAGNYQLFYSPALVADITQPADVIVADWVTKDSGGAPLLARMMPPLPNVALQPLPALSTLVLPINQVNIKSRYERSASTVTLTLPNAPSNSFGSTESSAQRVEIYVSKNGAKATLSGSYEMTTKGQSTSISPSVELPSEASVLSSATPNTALRADADALSKNRLQVVLPSSQVVALDISLSANGMLVVRFPAQYQAQLQTVDKQTLTLAVLTAAKNALLLPSNSVQQVVFMQ
jgi:trimeric autotransporter adhesin